VRTHWYNKHIMCHYTHTQERAANARGRDAHAHTHKHTHAHARPRPQKAGEGEDAERMQNTRTRTRTANTQGTHTRARDTCQAKGRQKTKAERKSPRSIPSTHTPAAASPCPAAPPPCAAACVATPLVADCTARRRRRSFRLGNGSAGARNQRRQQRKGAESIRVAHTCTHARTHERERPHAHRRGSESTRNILRTHTRMHARTKDTCQRQRPTHVHATQEGAGNMCSMCTRAHGIRSRPGRHAHAHAYAHVLGTRTRTHMYWARAHAHARTRDTCQRCSRLGRTRTLPCHEHPHTQRWRSIPNSRTHLPRRRLALPRRRLAQLRLPPPRSLVIVLHGGKYSHFGNGAASETRAKLWGERQMLAQTDDTTRSNLQTKIINTGRRG
jgi:hypothetical protein